MAREPRPETGMAGLPAGAESRREGGETRREVSGAARSVRAARLSSHPAGQGRPSRLKGPESGEAGPALSGYQEKEENGPALLAGLPTGSLLQARKAAQEVGQSPCRPRGWPA